MCHQRNPLWGVKAGPAIAARRTRHRDVAAVAGLEVTAHSPLIACCPTTPAPLRARAPDCARESVRRPGHGRRAGRGRGVARLAATCPDRLDAKRPARACRVWRVWPRRSVCVGCRVVARHVAIPLEERRRRCLGLVSLQCAGRCVQGGWCRLRNSNRGPLPHQRRCGERVSCRPTGFEPPLHQCARQLGRSNNNKKWGTSAGGAV